jgi:adenylyl-sulfate kinase
MKPTVVWITGLSGAGKTTTANALYELLKEKGYRVAVADADKVRLEFKTPVGFDIESRKKAVNGLIYAVRNMIEFQKAEIVIVASISPLKEMRNNARDILEKYSNARFIEVHMDTPLEMCEERDPKGLYKKYRAGLIKDMSGIDSPYEVPEFPEVRIHPRSTLFGEMTVERAVDIIYNRITTETIL